MRECLLVSLLLCLVICWMHNRSTASDIVLFNIMVVILVYLIVRLIMLYWPKVTNIAILLLIAGVCSYEVIIGVLQLFGLQEISDDSFTHIGTFDNPGPYGGFLAVCVSVLLTSSFQNKYIILKSLLSFSAIIGVIIIPSTLSRSAILALAVSVVVFVMSFNRYQNYIRKYWIWLLLSVLAMCIIAYSYKKSSAEGRLFMDKISLRVICSNGLKGVGFGNYAGAYGKEQASYFAERMNDSSVDLDWFSMRNSERLIADTPVYAFNDYLHLGVEAGPITMLLYFFLIIVSIIIALMNRSPWGYGLLTYAIFSFFSYPLMNLEFRILLAVLLAVGITPSRKIGTKHLSVVIYGMLLLLIIMLLLNKLSWYKKELRMIAKWQNIEKYYIKQNNDYFVEECDSLIEYLNYDYKFLYKYGQAVRLQGNYAKSDSLLLLGSIISSDPAFWNVMGINSMETCDYQKAEMCYKHSFEMVPNRLTPLYLLSKLYYNKGDKIRFFDLVNRLDTFEPKIESELTQQMRRELKMLKDKIEDEQ